MKSYRHYLRRPIALAVIAAAIATAWFLPPRETAAPDRERMPVMGVDLSSHNGYVDFGLLAGQGVEFAILKASEGVRFKDSRFALNRRRAEEAGLTVGAYHFFRFDADGAAQALNLINSLGGHAPQMPVAIDVERWHNSDTVSDDSVRMRLNGMIARLEDEGLRVMVYANQRDARRYFTQLPPGVERWMCNLKCEPEGVATIWQYSHKGRLDGVDGHVDLNVFTGSREAWMRWIGK